ncbi:mfs transporter [Rhodotorula toruloides]|uniref:Mfs transporter n=1 Tax=Rhodotorula toruloides TaxID=5286 RepID=A0A511KG74_RHOTO|nr:mfs transporter [Rhodotorula toruloides]
MAEKADTHSTNSLDAEKGIPVHQQQQQQKPAPTADHIEHYAQHTQGYSANLAAVQEAHGFKPEAGRLVVDPAEARVEYGEEVASRLKTNSKGTKILWPQPSDDPNDPQNWTPVKKNIQLLVLTMASFVPDFCSGLGIASLFNLAATFKTTTEEINNLTSNWSIFLLGPGGIAAVFFIKRFGRLPVLFWSQVIGLGFLIGCAVSPNLKTFAAMRCLTAFFSTAPQCVGLWTVCDLFPFHLQARKLNLWTMGFIVSPFISPFLLGYMIPTTNFRDVYWVGVAYCAVVVLLITFVMEETMYDRDVVPFPERHATGLKYRIDTLIGITGWKMRKYRCTWWQSISSVFDIVWRPHVFLMLVFVGFLFGCGIGINVTQAVFIGSPPPLGYGYSPYATASLYATPIVAVILGELAGRYINDGLADRLIKKNSGVFLAEMRLWTIYFAMPFYVVGFCLLGVAFQNKLPIAAVIFGWGMAEFGILILTVATYAYLNNCFPTRQGEVSALINLARTLGGFAIPYYQVPWSLTGGPKRVFGLEAGVGAALFVFIVIPLQFFGPSIRRRFSVQQ